MLKSKKLLQILIRSLSPEITYKKPQNNYISTRHFSRGRHFILFYSEVHMKNKKERKGEIPVSNGAHHPNSQPHFLFSSPSPPPPFLSQLKLGSADFRLLTNLALVMEKVPPKSHKINLERLTWTKHERLTTASLIRGWVPETSRSFHYWQPAPRWRLLPWLANPGNPTMSSHAKPKDFELSAISTEKWGSW